jgi:DHA1 family purine base/nucleoside efflux pump-like MFS transporter
LSDIFGRKRGLLSGLAFFGAGSFLSFLSTGFHMLLTGRILTGMGASMLSLNTVSYAADYFPYESRGWAMGSILSSYFAAWILGVPLGSWLGDRFGWNVVFGTLGAMALVLIVSTNRLLPRILSKSGSSSIMSASEYLRRYVIFLRDPVSAGGLSSSFFASAGTMGFIAFLGVWLHDSFGIPGAKTGLVFLASGLAALLASPLAGSLSDRVGKRLQFIISCAALGVLLSILPRLRWGPALFSIFGLVSLSAAFRQGPMEAVLTEIVPSDSRGSFVALKNSFSQLGIAVAAMLSGMLFERSGYGAVCLLGAGANLLAAASMLFTLRNQTL